MKAPWSIRGSRPIGIIAANEVEGRYYQLIWENGWEKYFAYLRIGLPDWIEGLSGPDGMGRRNDYQAQIIQTKRTQNVQAFWAAVYKAGIANNPMYPIDPIPEKGGYDDGGTNPRFESDIVYELSCRVRSGWDEDKTALALEGLEDDCRIMQTIIQSLLTGAVVERLTKGDLTRFLENRFGGRDDPLPAKIDARTYGRLQPVAPPGPSVAQVRTTPDFFVPNVADSGTGEVSLGVLQSAGGARHHPLSISPDELVRHIVMVGSTGSGKSSLAKLIAEQVAETGVPVLILDWAGEYDSFVEGLGGKVLTPGQSNFVLNPLENLLGRDLDDHVSAVSDIFNDIYHFSHPQKSMFEAALKETILSAGGKAPTIEMLLDTISAAPVKTETTPDTKNALYDRLVRLTRGVIGSCFNGTSTLTLDELLGSKAGMVSVNLRPLMEEQARTILSDILMKLVYEYRVARQQATGQFSSKLEHLLVIEEAKYLIPYRDPSDKDFAAVGERMVEEMRKYGEGIVIISQDPTQLAKAVIKNADIRAMFRLTAGEDLRTLGQVLNITDEQANYISNLQPGQAVISMTRLAHPVLVQVHRLTPEVKQEATA